MNYEDLRQIRMLAFETKFEIWEGNKNNFTTVINFSQYFYHIMEKISYATWALCQKYWHKTHIHIYNYLFSFQVSEKANIWIFVKIQNELRPFYF